MLLELFIFFEVIGIGLFIGSFFTKQEVLWAITLVIYGMLMISSYNIEVTTFEFNTTLQSYAPAVTNFHYPYIMAINMLFFVLSLIFFIFDLFDKYKDFAGDFTGRLEGRWKK